MIKKLVPVLAALAFASVGLATSAAADGPAVPPGLASSGTGWNTEHYTIDGATYHENSLPHGQTYTISFTDAASRTRLDPYALAAARQLNAVPSIVAAGIHFAVTTVLSPNPEPAGAVYPHACPAANRISLTLHKSAQSGMSWTDNCYTNYRFSRGADIWVTPEYWSTSHWFSTNPTVNTVRINAVVPHEIGHAIGLDHPASFTVPTGRAVPLMVPTVGGYQSIENSSKNPYTAYDITGINALVANGAK
jgi:hypothetical protein